jgi:hypothetical protein
MSTADEFLTLAESCHIMGLATNNSRWHSLAERWLHAAANPAASVDHETAVTAVAEHAAVGGQGGKTSLRKAAA